ncbi:DUF547 domain-containing protein [Candidatus Sumerlaeota bacterium]
MNSKRIFQAGCCALLALTSTVSSGWASDEAALRPGVAEAGAKVFDYSAYARVLKRHVDELGMVNYRALQKEPQDLGLFLDAAAKLRPAVFAKWDDGDKIALYCNVYNANTLKAILDHYPIKAAGLASWRFPASSIRQIPGVWDKLKFELMGSKVTLEHVEHEILRKQFREPRIHMALVCAAKGCPPLRQEPFTGARLDEQLDDQARRYLNSASGLQLKRDEGGLYVSRIFQWFADDFTKARPTRRFSGYPEKQRAVLAFIVRYGDKSVGEFLGAKQRSINYVEYDWSLNEQGS